MSKPLPWIVNTLFFLSCSLILSAQNQKSTVNGTVADAATGQLLADVNISIVGTSVGGTTNQSGEFSLARNTSTSVMTSRARYIYSTKTELMNCLVTGTGLNSDMTLPWASFSVHFYRLKVK